MKRMMQMIVGSSVVMISLAGCDKLISAACPNDPPPEACAADERCCAEKEALQACRVRNAPALCSADGKTDGNKFFAACEKEFSAAAQCGGIKVASCSDFDALSLALGSQPRDLDASERETNRVKLEGFSTLTPGVTCSALDGNSSPVGGTCTYNGLASNEVTYGPLPAGDYRLQLEFTFQSCTPRTILSNPFTVHSVPLSGQWGAQFSSTRGPTTLTLRLNNDQSFEYKREEKRPPDDRAYRNCTVVDTVKGTYAVATGASRIDFSAAASSNQEITCGPSQTVYGYSPTEVQTWNGKFSGNYTLAQGSLRLPSPAEIPELLRQ